MKTDDLIRALAADHHAPPPLTRTLALSLVFGVALSAVLFFVLLGPRPDIAQAATTLRFLLKPVETLLLAASAGFLVLRLAQPGAEIGQRIWLPIALIVLLVAAIAIELAVLPRGEWMPRLIGSNALVCMTAIPLLSLMPLGAALFALRQGAPTRPALAGALAGLLAGGLAATLYAVHCTDDSPLFVVTWYALAIGLVTLLGAIAGNRILRW